MNVIDYAIRLGKLLRKTEEGKRLLQLEAKIEEKYRNNIDFNQYEQFAERKTSQFYFYSWEVAYNAFLNVLVDDSMEHRDLFIKTAELVSSDEEIKELVLMAKSFGNRFERIVSVCISGGEYEKVIPHNWKYKIKNSISDLQISIERTFLMRTIAIFHQKHHDLINNAATKKYLIEREEKMLLPFSQKAMEVMAETKDVSEEEKILYEKMYLIMEAVKKGVFYGFWGMVNEINKEELLDSNVLYDHPLHEVTFSHTNNASSFLGNGWLYKIQLDDGYIFFMAHKKTVNIMQENGKSVISGIVYPSDDRGLFSETGCMRVSD